ncbi:hypothetical protein AVEN_165824-1 [Araneus ventricosus]|uniref:Uncharacterized protein n=1 Tax=Araneus ventricosus TaxID=182803 RepID=A0A4Y2ENZ0_ARAVE|nr:hypothetical protein AVEN_165824-1 [Araneus ventricosus]
MKEVSFYKSSINAIPRTLRKESSSFLSGNGGSGCNGDHCSTGPEGHTGKKNSLLPELLEQISLRSGLCLRREKNSSASNSQYDAMAEKCSLCEDYVVTDKCGVGEKGIDGLIKASIARKDGKHEIFRGQKKIVLHASCRKKYTRPQSITRDLKIAVLDG